MFVTEGSVRILFTCMGFLSLKFFLGGCFVLFSLSRCVGNYVVTTIAGTDEDVGDGGIATSSVLFFPRQIALDADGNVYIADTYNRRVRFVNASTGLISTIAGTGVAGYSGDGGAATSAKTQHPHGVALDADGNVYIADTNNHRIRKLLVPTLRPTPSPTPDPTPSPTSPTPVPTISPTPSPTFPFEGAVIIVDNLVDSPAYPLNCTTFGQTGKCNFRSATWACQTMNDICNILLPPNESIFLMQEEFYGSTYNPELPTNVSIVYRDANTYLKEFATGACCYSCIVEGVDKAVTCSAVWISSDKPPHLAKNTTR